MLLMGDFNFKEIDWTTNSTSVSETHPATLFLESTRDCFLWQHVTKLLDTEKTKTPTILDLILTNEENMISSLEYFPGLGKK